MDDLLDLNWVDTNSKQNNSVETSRAEKPRDAFADLLSIPAKKSTDVSKLSLLERQKLQQQASGPTSPWNTTPLSATTSRSNTPLSPTTVMSPSVMNKNKSATVNKLSSIDDASKSSNQKSSFDNLLDPFSFNSNKTKTQDKNTPINQLRNVPTPESTGSNWDFDLLDAKFAPNQQSPVIHTSSPISNVDPFDVEELHQQNTHPQYIPQVDDDNPLGILAQPAVQQNKKQNESEATKAEQPQSTSDDEPVDDSVEKKVTLDEEEEDAKLAQLIDMGFSLQQSKFAIEATLGQDMQAAVDLLIQSSETVERVQSSSIVNTFANQHAPFSASPPPHEASQVRRARNVGHNKFKDDQYSDAEVTPAQNIQTLSSQKASSSGITPFKDLPQNNKARDFNANKPKASKSGKVDTTESLDTDLLPTHTPLPVVTAPPEILAQANKARVLGNDKFKVGQFGEAEVAYTQAIDVLPSGHDLHALLYNNRAATRLKTGDYKKCIEDCNEVFNLCNQKGSGSVTIDGVNIQWRDQVIKSLYRKAEALENIEKYKDALSTYDILMKYEGTTNANINQRMSRCRQALNPTKSVPKPRNAPSQVSKTQDSKDLMAMFDPAVSAATMSSSTSPSREELNKSKAVAAMRAKAAEQEAEDAEKLQKIDDVNARILAWKGGKEQNLRALLATLDTLLWPGAQWKGSQMSELINPKKCKITYMKAISKVHPDKLPPDTSVENKMLAGGIFSALNEAWDSFKDQNQL